MALLANLTKVHCFDKTYLMAAVKKQPPPYRIKRTCSSFHCYLIHYTPIRHTSPEPGSRLQPALARPSWAQHFLLPQPGSPAAALIAWSLDQEGLWLDGSIIIGWPGHGGIAPPRAILRTEKNRSAPSICSDWQDTRDPAGGRGVSFYAAFAFALNS